MSSEYRWSNYAVVGQNRYLHKGIPHRMLYHSAGPSLLLIKDSEYQAIDKALPKPSDLTVFKVLLKRGIIRTDPPRTESSHIVSRLFHPDRHNAAFAIMTTNDCNMRCGYCGQCHRNVDMSKIGCEEVADHIINSAKRNNLSNINLRWYGGEPLLNPQAIFEISDRIERASRCLGFSFDSEMASNGTLLSTNLIKKLAKDAHLAKLDITLDGFQADHDLSRPLLSGKPSYERIKAELYNISMLDLNQLNLLITIRVNITNRNYDKIDKLVSDLGFISHDKHFSIQFMPVYEWGVNSRNYRPNRSVVNQSIVQCLAQANQMGIQVELLPLQRLNAPCIASTTMAELISVEGDIYSCTEYPLSLNDHKSHILGNIKECNSLPRNTDELDCYHLLLADSNCSRCPFFPVCGGGCPRKQIAHTFECPNYKTTFSERCNLIASKLGLEIIPRGAAASTFMPKP